MIRFIAHAVEVPFGYPILWVRYDASVSAGVDGSAMWKVGDVIGLESSLKEATACVEKRIRTLFMETAN